MEACRGSLPPPRRLDESELASNILCRLMDEVSGCARGIRFHAPKICGLDPPRVAMYIHLSPAFRVHLARRGASLGRTFACFLAPGLPAPSPCVGAPLVARGHCQACRASSAGEFLSSRRCACDFDSSFPCPVPLPPGGLRHGHSCAPAGCGGFPVPTPVPSTPPGGCAYNLLPVWSGGGARKSVTAGVPERGGARTLTSKSTLARKREKERERVGGGSLDEARLAYMIRAGGEFSQ